MSIHFHKLLVKKIKRETPDCVSLLLEVPDDLKERFAYTQGQSLTVRTTLGKEEVRRTYSLCSSPLDGEWRVAVKKVEGGLFSGWANDQLQPGDFIEVMEPVGKFNTSLHPGHKKNYLALAAGSGITPVLSIIKTTLQTEPDSRFTLVYGNRNRSSIIFFEELESLKNKYLDRFQLLHVLSRERTDTPVHFGRIGPGKLEELKKILPVSSFDEIFICGPEEMIFSSRDWFQRQGVDPGKIHFELFTSSSRSPTRKKTGKENKEDRGALSTITLKLDSRSFDFQLPLNSDTTILDAALEQGADLPYACKGGMCCTCKARLVEGEVSMDVHWGLEEEEIEQGYILTCQSHPKTEKLIVDFDIK